MNKEKYIASAPATLKLLGEYAVLHNHPAVACALDFRISCTVIPRSDDIIIIKSSLATYETTVANLTATKPLQFVLLTLMHWQKLLPCGCEIIINEGFSSTVGLGSSAAVTVACITAVAMWLKLELTDFELLKIAHHIVLQVQNVASGIDLAASIFGGLIEYRQEPLTVIKINNQPELALVFSGQKTPTAQSVAKVKATFSQLKDLEQSIYQLMGNCVEEALPLFAQADWQKLGLIFNIHHGLQEALGTATPALSEVVHALRGNPGITGAKISGSGFGDCAVGLGKIITNTFPQNTEQQKKGIKQIDVRICAQGVQRHYE